MRNIIIMASIHSYNYILAWSRALLSYSPSAALAANQQETAESEQSLYQHPLMLSIADDDNDNDSDVQPEYDYINNNDQQPVVIELTQCPAYRSTIKQQWSILLVVTKSLVS